MKNEIARREIESLDYYLQNHTNDYSEESHTAMMMAIKALKQEDCEDAISRQAVLAVIKNNWNEFPDDYDFMQESINAIEALQPVTPQPKSGHWIAVTNGRGGHECSLCHEYASSYKDGDERLTKYCPSCGAKMVEPQETETWNGIHGQIIAPKGTFERIFNDVDDDDDDI